jgi:23S rRNA (pseudouridine1915-N3)-methyltransferase
LKIHLYYVGKPRDSHANSLAGDYIARCDRYVRSQMREVQPDRFDPWTKHASAAKIVLDPAGKSFDSDQFARLIGKAEQEARDLVFLVGGANGVPEAWRDRGGLMLSLSPLTFPHELARVMLAEQIYRALATLRGHPYPK